MNPALHPYLLDRLAAEYALGTLRGGARRRLEKLAQQDTTVRDAINTWQARLATLPELAPSHAPGAHVWHGVRHRLGFDSAQPGKAAPVASPAPQAAPVPLWHCLSFWRRWAIAATVCAVMAITFALRSLLPGLSGQSAAPAIGYVAILNDNQAHAGMLVTWDARRRVLVFKALAPYPLNAAQVMQLWGLPPRGQPQALGLLPRQGVLEIQMDRPPPFPALAISVEPAGGSPNPHAPSGPVIYHGVLLPTT